MVLLINYIIIIILCFVVSYLLIKVFNKNSKIVFMEFMKKKLGGEIVSQDKTIVGRSSVLYFASVICLCFTYLMLYNIASISDMDIVYWFGIFIALVIILFVIKKLGFKDPSK